MTLLVASVFMMAMYCQAKPESVQLLVFKICEQTYGTLITTLQTPSLVACSIGCTSYPNCLSVWYDNDTGKCQLITEKAPALDTNCLDKLQYAEITKGTFGERCRDSSDCKTVESTCVGFICMCPFAHSHNSSSDICFPGCHTYGTAFSTITGYRLAQNNNKQLDVTSDAAKQACLNEKTFICRSVDCLAYADRCWLSEETMATKVTQIEQNNDYNYYNRECE